jgi:hypothetical protein
LKIGWFAKPLIGLKSIVFLEAADSKEYFHQLYGAAAQLSEHRYSRDYPVDGGPPTTITRSNVAGWQRIIRLSHTSWPVFFMARPSTRTIAVH